MAAALRWLSLLVCLAASSSLIGQLAGSWPKEIVLFEKQAEVLSIAENASRAIVQHPLFVWTLVALTSFAAGIWLEWLAKKFDESRRRKALGRMLVSLGRQIDSAQDGHESEWSWSIQHFQVDLRSAFQRTSRLGLWVPDNTILLLREANLLIAYLTVVGTLLAEGRLAEAREESLRCRDLLRAERARLRAMASHRGESRTPRHIRVVSARPN
jgi:hypothetical protein